MNILESANIRSPNEIEEECAHFTITDTEQPFVLNDIAKQDEKYTFSAWVKGSGEISILGNNFPVTAEWTKCVITFISDSTDVEIYFRETGDYYFYNSQLEIGEKDTDYSPAPEDLEADAQYKADNALASAKTYADSQIKASADSVLIAVSQSYATVDTVTGVEKRVTDAEALINVQAGLIEQKVSVNGVISAINQSAEEIKISASKITLEGETIADAFTCTNLTVAGDSTFSGVLNGATGIFSGIMKAESIYIYNPDVAGNGRNSQISMNNDGVNIETYETIDDSDESWIQYNRYTVSSNDADSVFARNGIVIRAEDRAIIDGGQSSLNEFCEINITPKSLNVYSHYAIGAEPILTIGSERMNYDGSLIVQSLTVQSDMWVDGYIKSSKLSWYTPSNENFDEVQLRLAGNVGTQGISFVTVKDGTTSVFGNIFDANNRFMPDFPVAIYHIQSYAFSSSGTVKNGSTTTMTTTLSKTVPSGYSYATLVGKSSYCNVSNVSISGSTLSVTLLNISGGTHTLRCTVTVIIYKNRW